MGTGERRHRHRSRLPADPAVLHTGGRQNPAARPPRQHPRAAFDAAQQVRPRRGARPTFLTVRAADMMSVYISREPASEAFTAKIEKLAARTCWPATSAASARPAAPWPSTWTSCPTRSSASPSSGLRRRCSPPTPSGCACPAYTCNTRCPKGVKIAEVIEAIRRVRLRARKDHLDCARTRRGGPGGASRPSP